MTRTALPGLRVIGMAYTGLIGMVAVVVVVSVAFLPGTPVLQEASQPARGTVGSIVQPATDAVTSIAGFRRVAPEAVPRVVPAPTAALPSDLSSQDLGGAEALAEPPATAETPPEPPLVPGAPRAQTTRIVLASPPVALASAPEDSGPIAEEVPPEQPAPTAAAIDPPPEKPMVPADRQIQQAADVETPKPLPPTPRPTETVAQTRARLEAENQAAIDAAKATQARLKAEGDAANQAAIDARKAATAMLVIAPRQTRIAEAAAVTPRPTPVADVAKSTPAASHTKAAMDAENQVQIDAAKAAAARARSDANAANQAAIDSTKAAKFATPATSKTAAPPPPVAVVPTPTALEPAATPGTEPAPMNPIATPVAPASVAPADEQVFQQDEAPVMLALEAPEA
ncbi:MAG: hypothetical protein M3069_02150 [Chloroflexota bacterium]|nr:hypothetical protein [Chloroflexota bacterium]